MPIYEYACPHCQKTFEEWIKSADDQADSFPCPHCGQDAPRIISQTTFILKGSGWYVTEYGGHSEATEGGAEAGAPDSSDVADAKPADTGTSETAKTADGTASTTANTAAGAGESKVAPAKEAAKPKPATPPSTNSSPKTSAPSPAATA